MTEDETTDEERAEKLPDADYRFPPLVKPAEDPERTMAMVDAQADLMMTVCPFCRRTPEVVEMAPGGILPTVWGFTHHPGCPECDPDM